MLKEEQGGGSGGKDPMRDEECIGSGAWEQEGTVPPHISGVFFARGRERHLKKLGRSGQNLERSKLHAGWLSTRGGC